MTKIKIDMGSNEIERGDLDCLEKIELIEQADRIWATLEIELPLAENYIRIFEGASDMPEAIEQLEKSFDKYIQAITEIKAFAAPILEDAYSMYIDENTISIGHPFESYEAAKTRADEWEKQQPVRCQVTLRTSSRDLPQEPLEQIEKKKRTLGDKSHE